MSWTIRLKYSNSNSLLYQQPATLKGGVIITEKLLTCVLSPMTTPATAAWSRGCRYGDGSAPPLAILPLTDRGLHSPPFRPIHPPSWWKWTLQSGIGLKNNDTCSLNFTYLLQYFSNWYTWTYSGLVAKVCKNLWFIIMFIWIHMNNDNIFQLTHYGLVRPYGIHVYFQHQLR